MKDGALEERTIGHRMRADFEQALRREGITMSHQQREIWLNERIEVPDWAQKLKRKWRRAEPTWTWAPPPGSRPVPRRCSPCR